MKTKMPRDLHHATSTTTPIPLFRARPRICLRKALAKHVERLVAVQHEARGGNLNQAVLGALGDRHGRVERVGALDNARRLRHKEGAKRVLRVRVGRVLEELDHAARAVDEAAEHVGVGARLTRVLGLLLGLAVDARRRRGRRRGRLGLAEVARGELNVLKVDIDERRVVVEAPHDLVLHLAARREDPRVPQLRRLGERALGNDAVARGAEVVDLRALAAVLGRGADGEKVGQIARLDRALELQKLLGLRVELDRERAIIEAVVLAVIGDRAELVEDLLRVRAHVERDTRLGVRRVRELLVELREQRHADLIELREVELGRALRNDHVGLRVEHRADDVLDHVVLLEQRHGAVGPQLRLLVDDRLLLLEHRVQRRLEVLLAIQQLARQHRALLANGKGDAAGGVVARGLRLEHVDLR